MLGYVKVFVPLVDTFPLEKDGKSFVWKSEQEFHQGGVLSEVTYERIAAFSSRSMAHKVLDAYLKSVQQGNYKRHIDYEVVQMWVRLQLSKGSQAFDYVKEEKKEEPTAYMNDDGSDGDHF